MKKTTLVFGFALVSLLAFSQTSPQIFTSAGPFVVPSGVTSITVEVVGAGGAGGGNGGGGGGGGGYAKGVYTVTPLSTLFVAVAPGTSTTGINLLGILASSGADGGSVPNPTIGGGGAGGVGTGGTIANFTGGTGGGGYWTYFGGGGGGAAGPFGNGSVGGNTIAYVPGGCITPGGAAGLSGGSPGGDGGKGAGFTDAACNVTDPAAVGVNYGGGGGGGNGNGGVAMNGAGGYVIISWVVATDIEAQAINPISVFPNPLIDKIVVTNARGKENYELMNALGQIVWSGNAIEQHNFSDLTKGVYMLRVVSEKSAQVFKLMKE